MPRVKGSGLLGVVRSLRLPRALDAWFEQRLRELPQRAASDLLLELIHGGLRLRPGYMTRHRQHLEQLLVERKLEAYAAYREALVQTFGERYSQHLDAWLKNDGVLVPERAPQKAAGTPMGHPIP